MNESFVKINKSFISERVNKIRFIEEEQAILEPTKFLTGSSENKSNNLKLWKLVRNNYAEEDNDDDNDVVPKAMAKLSLDGEVSGIELIDHNNFAASAGSSISLIYINRDQERNNLRENRRFENIHKFKNGDAALCTGISVFDENISSIGEDGRINLISATTQKIITSLEDTDSVTQTAIRFVNYKELITGNRMGVMNSFDLRSGNKKPTATFAVSCEDEKKCNGVTSITHHPTQQHIILAASEEGSITVYDLRQPAFPSTYLCAHDFAITELMFHPTQPDKLFTASSNGELWKWTQNLMQPFTQDFDNRNMQETANSWLNGERAKNKIAITSVLSGLRKSVTSIDCSKQARIICSCNNEAVYVIDNVF
jgi:nuclear pore complex protein Nup43